jgi:hypothetical protein
MDLVELSNWDCKYRVCLGYSRALVTLHLALSFPTMQLQPLPRYLLHTASHPHKAALKSGTSCNFLCSCVGPVWCENVPPWHPVLRILCLRSSLGPSPSLIQMQFPSVVFNSVSRSLDKSICRRSWNVPLFACKFVNTKLQKTPTWVSDPQLHRQSTFEVANITADFHSSTPSTLFT